MTGINAYANPGFIINFINNKPDLLEFVTQISPLPCRILNNSADIFRFIKNYIDRFRDPAETFLFAYSLQVASGVKIQSVETKLFTSLHFIKERSS